MPKDTTPGKSTTRRYSPEEQAAAGLAVVDIVHRTELHQVRSASAYSVACFAW